jgi:hypothetical protein
VEWILLRAPFSDNDGTVHENFNPQQDWGFKTFCNVYGKKRDEMF